MNRDLWAGTFAIIVVQITFLGKERPLLSTVLFFLNPFPFCDLFF